MGSLFFFLRDALLRFYKRIKDINIHFRLFNVDAQELPGHLSTEESQFDRIEVSNICDRGYLGPEKILSTFSPLLKSKIINLKAVLLMLFLNAVSEVYYNDPNSEQRFNESRLLIQKFIPVTPITLITMIVGGASIMTSPEMIRISSCYTMFGDFEKAFGTFLKDVQIHKLTKKYRIKIKEKHSIIEPWPLRVTEKTTKEEFEIRLAPMFVPGPTMPGVEVITKNLITIITRQVKLEVDINTIPTELIKPVLTKIVNLSKLKTALKTVSSK
ncbi:hypothetical protein G7Y89_g11691 [Cudoniella acicularis]|uniref:Uncharacterized protein n=1 Tax=Cudoniella acicularis TaxID=354080 RepID=A0A8H4RBW3_9HELO|nr:hypothetical protein G7Y89_g11691 [Cudoniella acicularis]